MRLLAESPTLAGMKVILTGATGMVGEGVLLECLENPAVEQVLSVSRRASGRTHGKLSELLVPDFRELGAVEAKLSGYDACFYCAGISSVGMKEADYALITYDTVLAFASTLLRLNPGMTFVHVSGSHTDSSEQGKVMWARVKGKAENALNLVFPGMPLSAVARAMIHAVRHGAPKPVLEVADIRQLAAR